jgi:hypothetical protein
MTNIKSGENVWFLIEEHGWGSSPCMINNLNIRCEKVLEVFSEYLQVTHVEEAFLKEDAYKSKNEVIEALIQQLEIMKE